MQKLQETLIADGALRDIIIRDTQFAHWQQVCSTLVKKYQTRYQRDGETLLLSSSIEKVILDKEASHSFIVMVAGIGFKTHFFIENEIEFDFDPKDCSQPDDYKHIIDFMTVLMAATKKNVHLYYEGADKNSEPSFTIFAK